MNNMPGGRRGLVAPQNTFLETLIKRASAQAGDTGFILCNAQIVDFPVVYCSEEFSKLLGFPRSDVMRNSIRCELMGGALTEESTIGNHIFHNTCVCVTIVTFQIEKWTTYPSSRVGSTKSFTIEKTVKASGYKRKWYLSETNKTSLSCSWSPSEILPPLKNLWKANP